MCGGRDRIATERAPMSTEPMRTGTPDPDDLDRRQPRSDTPDLDEQRQSPARKPLSDAAKRALAEADERRQARERAEAARPREIGGQDGPDPIRYGDWEKDGICSDF